jgi:hypothetical protein
MKAKWREYLKGEYVPSDVDKMNFEIRKRARQMMRDLLLIARKMPRRQRILIFKNPDNEFWKNVAFPLSRELQNNICCVNPEDYNIEELEEIQFLAKGLMLHGIKFDPVKLVENRGYREQKEIWLKSETGERKIVSSTTSRSSQT